MLQGHIHEINLHSHEKYTDYNVNTTECLQTHSEYS